MSLRHISRSTKIMLAFGAVAVVTVAAAFAGGVYLASGSLTDTTKLTASASKQEAARASERAARSAKRVAATHAKTCLKARKDEIEKAQKEAVQADRAARAERVARAKREDAAKAAQAKREAEAKAKAKAEAAEKAAAKRAAAAKAEAADKPRVVNTVTGQASYFGDASEYQPMACGGNTREITKGVALWKIPCGTLIRITSKETGKSVVAPVRDRGPAEWTGVEIDLLPDTWDALGVDRSQGKQDVTYEVLDKTVD